MQCLKVSNSCVFGEKLGNGPENLVFIPILNLIHINFIF
jgi:hypothetical protein